MRRHLKEAGLPEVEFKFTTFFTVIFKRSRITLKMKKPIGRMEKFGIKGNRLKRILSILDILYKAEPFSITDFAAKTEVTPRAIEKDIEFLRKQGIIEFQGARKTGRYILTEKGEKLWEG